MSMTYQKINTLWKREMNGKKKGCIIPGEYSEEEIKSITRWSVSEKIDGMNTRIIYDTVIFDEKGFPDVSLKFGGKTDKAEMPSLLGSFLEEHFTKEKFGEVFPGVHSVVLFGEGYGKKIQEPHGRRYIADSNKFILFDVWIDGVWLEYNNVADIASKFGIESVPFVGILTKDEIINLVKEGPLSEVSETPQRVEGYVCTSYPMMYYRNQQSPIRFKLKCSDYDKWKDVRK